MDIKAFRGLNNITEPLRLGADWFVRAENVDITDSGAVQVREGYSLAQAGTMQGIYTTLDYQRCYVVEGGAIRSFDGIHVVALTSNKPVYWTEVNDQVFFNNGVDGGVIMPDHSYLPWRREITVNKYVGADIADPLLDALLDPLPLGTDIVQYWRGRMYTAQYLANENQTVVWFSQPLGFHLFSLDSDYFVLPGRVTMLAPHDAALIAGTNKRIYAYDSKSLTELAQYGVVPGQHWALDELPDGTKRTLFWTTRGLCSAVPFKNLTERQVSVAPGVSAGGTIVRQGGQKRYVVALAKGDAAFNPYV